MTTATLDQYLDRVEKYLPPWQSRDLLVEIRSNILDQAEEIAEERGVSVDDQVLAEIIERLGAPEKIAEAYRPSPTLIREEYSSHFILYTLILVLVHSIFQFFAVIFSTGEFWVSLGLLFPSVLLDIGIGFLFFAALSRMKKPYRLPLWFPGFGRLLDEISPRIGHAVKKSKDFLGSRVNLSNKKKDSTMNAQDQDKFPTSSESVFDREGDMKPKSPSPPMQKVETRSADHAAEPRSFAERMIEDSAPGPLGPIRMLGAGARIVIGLAFLGFFVFAPPNLHFLTLNYDDPRHGWTLICSAPGFEPLRSLGIFASSLMTLSGLISIFTGFSLASLGASILNKGSWAVLFAASLSRTPILFLDFQANSSFLQRDWSEGASVFYAIQPVIFFFFLFLVLLTLVGRFCRLGLMLAWYRNRREKKIAEAKHGLFTDSTKG